MRILRKRKAAKKSDESEYNHESDTKGSDESEDKEEIGPIHKPVKEMEASEKSGGSTKRKGAVGVGPGHLPCFYCGERFSSPNSLRVHLEYIHLWQP